MFEPTAIYAPNPHRYDTMTYNRAGTSGLKLPAVSLGFWHNFGDITPFDQMKSLVFTAFDNGITHFDLANKAPNPARPRRTADCCSPSISNITATNSSSPPRPAMKCGQAPRYLNGIPADSRMAHDPRFLNDSALTEKLGRF